MSHFNVRQEEIFMSNLMRTTISNQMNLHTVFIDKSGEDLPTMYCLVREYLVSCLLELVCLLFYS